MRAGTAREGGLGHAQERCLSVLHGVLRRDNVRPGTGERVAWAMRRSGAFQIGTVLRMLRPEPAMEKVRPGTGREPGLGHGFMNVLAACKTDTIAPHIPVLYRDIPFILNITVLKQGTAHPRLYA